MSIPWWGWLALWVSLTLVLLIVLALSAWRLFRKFLRVLDDFGALASSGSILDGVDTTVPPRTARAVLVPLSIVIARRSALKARSAARKIERHKRRIARGRALVAVDVASREWFPPVELN